MAPRAGALLLALLGAACGGTGPIVVPAQFDTWPAAARLVATRAQPPAGCGLQLASVRDLRADPPSLGNIGPREVRADDFAAWVRGGLDGGLRKPAAAAAPVSIDAEILKAYVHWLAISKSADIVLRVRFSRDNQVVGEKVYRGANTAMNWASGDDEIRWALAEALAALVVQVNADAPGYCPASAPQADGASPAS
jgi:hypothetical protein